MFGGVTRVTFCRDRGWINSLFELLTLWKTWVLWSLSNRLICWEDYNYVVVLPANSSVEEQRVKNCRVSSTISKCKVDIFYLSQEGYIVINQMDNTIFMKATSSSWSTSQELRRPPYKFMEWRPERRGEALVSLIAVPPAWKGNFPCPLPLSKQECVATFGVQSWCSEKPLCLYTWKFWRPLK